MGVASIRTEVRMPETTADLLKAAHDALDELHNPGYRTTVHEVHAAIDRAVEYAEAKAVSIATQTCIRAEKIALSKRDAEWREVARVNCDIYGEDDDRIQDDPCCACGACRTVARMEGKEG
jgi:hypothetical protein